MMIAQILFHNVFGPVERHFGAVRIVKEVGG